MIHKIEQVKTIRGFLLWVAFRDGAEKLYDMLPLFESVSAFQELKANPVLFEQVSVDVGGYGISWNDELDLDGDELYANGETLKNPLTLDAGTPCPACGQLIRRKSEAQKAASRANLAQRKSKGGRPVNPASKRQQTLRQKSANAL